jgi:hypothetical protein
LKCLKKPLKKQTFQYLEYVDRNRDNEQRKKEKKRVKEENPSSLRDSYLKDMYNRFDLPEQKNIMVGHPFIYNTNINSIN